MTASPNLSSSANRHRAIGPLVKTGRHESAYRWYRDPELVESFLTFETDYSERPKQLALECALAHLTGSCGRILEYGCGSGKGLFYLRRRLPSAEIWAVPTSEALLPAVAARSDEGVECILPEALSERGPFDLIVSYSAFRFLVDPAGHLRRLADRLRPGGILYVQDFDGGARPDLIDLLCERLSRRHEDYFRDQLSASTPAAAFKETLKASGCNVLRFSAGGICGYPNGSDTLFRLIARNHAIGDALMRLSGYGFGMAAAAEIACHCFIGSNWEERR